MIILLSPAKTLDYSKDFNFQPSVPTFLNDSSKLVKGLKSKEPKDIASLMSLSDKLATLNFERFQSWSAAKKIGADAKHALFVFKGDVYQGLQAEDFSEGDVNFAQKHLRILSGLYGELRPLDLIKPYRLEMGTKISVNGSSNLYEYWSNDVTKFLSDELLSSEFLLNLASNEYFSAIDKSKINSEIISPIFKDFKNGKLKIISFYAKKARGMMVRYIADNLITSYDNLLSFNYGGYMFNENETKDRNQPVFTR